MANHSLLQQIFKVVCLMYIFFTVQTRSASSCEKLSSKFLVEPVDMQIERGDDAVFQCSVDISNQQTKSIVWNIYPQLNQNPAITRVYDDETLLSNITIPSSSSHSVLYVSCIVEEVAGGVTACFSSREVVLYTIYFPTKEELVCNPPLINEMNIGDTLSLRCSVPRSNPPVDIGWKVLPEGRSIPPSLNDVGFLRVVTHDLSITRDLHLKIIRCQVSSEFAFPGEQLQCSVGPLMIRHPPEVQVFPQTKQVEILEQIELACTAAAYPEVMSFTWTCFPEDVLTGCGVTTSSRHTFIITKSTVKSVHIICTASNQEGVGRGYAYLDIVDNITTYLSDNTTSDEYFEKEFITSKLHASLGNEHEIEYTTDKIVSTDFPVQTNTQGGSPVTCIGSIIKPLIPIIIGGIMLLLAIIMFVVSVCLCILNRKTKDSGTFPDPTAMQNKSETMTPSLPAFSSGIRISEEPFYEMPRQNPLNSDVNMDRSVENRHDSLNESGVLFHEYSSTSDPDTFYENKMLVDSKPTRGIKAECSRAIKQEILDSCEKYPMPELPIIYTTRGKK